MRRPSSRGLVVWIVILTSAIGRPARANDPATATMLFNEARRLVAAHKYIEACPKFEESERLDPGIGTQFNLADCYEHTQRAASAWALFLDVASSAGGAGQEAREMVARKRAAALEPKLSKLTIEAPKNVTGLEIRRNGDRIGSVLWNSALPVDPGSYTIDASAPGKTTWSTVATVGPNGANVIVSIPALEPGAVSAAEVVSTPDDARNDAPPPGAEGTSRETIKLEKTVAVSLAGTGVAALGIGTFFGLRSISKHSDYEALCAGNVCSPAAGPLHDSAVSAGNVSTVAFLLGGALIAGGAVVWVTAPKTSSAAGVRVGPTAGTSNAGVAIAGAW